MSKKTEAKIQRTNIYIKLSLLSPPLSEKDNDRVVFKNNIKSLSCKQPHRTFIRTDTHTEKMSKGHTHTDETIYAASARGYQTNTIFFSIAKNMYTP